MLSKCCSIAKMGIFSVTAIGVTLILTGWAASTGIAQAEVEEVINPVEIVPAQIKDVINSVKLVPQEDRDNLKVPVYHQCKKDTHPGCLFFERNTLVHVIFHLPGSKNQGKDCSETENVITKIEVTATAANEGTSVNKGDFDRSTPLPAWLKENAFPDINLDTGIIYQEKVLDVARSRQLVTNLNNHLNPSEGTVEVKSFWYKITVTACAENEDGTHRTWVSDPRGDNEGRH